MEGFSGMICFIYLFTKGCTESFLIHQNAPSLLHLKVDVLQGIFRRVGDRRSIGVHPYDLFSKLEIYLA